MDQNQMERLSMAASLYPFLFWQGRILFCNYVLQSCLSYLIIKEMRYPNFSQERELWSLGYTAVAGLDEAGRGAWAGPVVAGAAVLSPDTKIAGLKDSKLLTPEKRELLYKELTAEIDWAIGVVEPEQIDKINILQASRLAMKMAISALKCQPDFALLDAVRIGDLQCRQRAVIKGDRKVMTIAAASIIAKVSRDRLMIKYHEEFPQYGFAIHKGYGTKPHQESLQKFGPSPIHRLSYKPLRAGNRKLSL